MGIGIEVDAAEVGMDAGRLERVDRHFRRYVDDGRLPGWSVLVARRGRIVHLSHYGMRDVEASLPVEPDTVFRIYSMTKPITSVAAMMLWEEGGFALTDAVHRYLPEFRDTRVWAGGSSRAPITTPQADPMRIWQLFTHTSGLTYGFHYVHPTDELYRAAGYEFQAPKGATLADACEVWAGLPLRFQPGTRWNYSVSTDVLGRLVEVVSGQSLDVFFRERIFEPLGMTETAFDAIEWADRLAALYVPTPGTKQAMRFDPFGKPALRKQTFLSGGGGLVSTMHDYHRFTQMLVNGGELDGARVLGPRTLGLMARNHLPGGADLASLAEEGMSELAPQGLGFGLGFAVTLDPGAARLAGSVGDLAWGGAASTGFWVDPAEELTSVFMTQLLPSSTYPLRAELRQLVYQAIVD